MAGVQKPRSAAPLVSHLLYDEFDLKKKKGRLIYTHSLLLTGMEAVIEFSSLRLRWFGRVLLSNGSLSDLEREWADDDTLAVASS